MPRRVVLTRGNVEAIAEVFDIVKSGFQYSSDAVAFAKDEYWISPAEIRMQLAQCGKIVGDCDDFASACVMFARARKLPARFVLCFTEMGETHLVCEIDGWILDNRQSSVERRDDLNYQWIAISGYSRGDQWHLIVK